MTRIGTATVTQTRTVHGLPPAPAKRRKDATKLSEREFMAQVVAFAKLHGWKVYHTHDSRRSESGFPDLVMVRRGEILFAELKVGKGKPTDAQWAWLCDLREAHAQAWVWRPEHWQTIEGLLS